MNNIANNPSGSSLLLNRAGTMKHSFFHILALTIALIFISAPAFAYIDPGTGSFLVQGIIAAVIGVGVTGKLYWSKIKAMLTGKAMEEDDDDE